VRLSPYTLDHVAGGADRMPAITLGLVEIESRLRLVRRRWNGRIVQHAAYFGASLLVLAAALLIVLALGDGVTAFGVAFWAAIAAVVLVTAVATRLVRRRWLSLDQVARRVDQTAQLDDRLSTLVGCAPQLQRSPLGGVLIRQLLALSPRWAPEQIAGRRVPRSLWLLIGSLCLLLVIAFLERRSAPPAGPRTAAEAAGDRTGRLVPVQGLNAKGQSVALSTKEAGAENEAPDDSGASGDDANADQAGGQKSGGSQRAHEPFAPDGSPGSPEGTGEGRKGEGVPERVQKLIRGAFGAKMLAPPHQVAGGTSGSHERAEAEAPRAGQQQGASQRPAAPPPFQGGGSRGSDTEQTAHSPPASAPHAENGHEGTQQGGGAPRAGGGTGAGALFGAAAPGEHEGSAAKTFQLKLSSFGNSFRVDTEPQTRKETESVPTSGTVAGAGGETELNPDQSADDPLHKSEIPPEHEATVRQIFSLRE